jgi:dinuclear metal center YbgI/SA1388 family protein
MPATQTLHTIAEFLNSELYVGSYTDAAYNGLQIDSGKGDISSIAFAVDAGESVMEAAIDRGCQLLVVHHGVLWGKAEPVVGPWARKLSRCFEKGLSLYAAHLPLDGHPTLGNAALVATEVLHAQEVSSAFEYQGSPIGVVARLPKPTKLDSVTQALAACSGGTYKPLLLPFGQRMISRVGIATGSATFLIPQAARLGLDLFITGEPKQEAYHVAKELSISVACMGHYASETFGVRALERVLKERFGVETEWIDEPTGI